MEIYERMKQLRKEILKLTQDEFSKGINITRSNVASIESGRINITDRVIADICAAFNVSEEWLRTGEGEMMSQKSKSIVDELSAIYRLDERRKRLLGNFLSLNDEDQEKLIGAIEVVARMCEGAQKEKAAPEISEAEYEKAQAIVDAYAKGTVPADREPFRRWQIL